MDDKKIITLVEGGLRNIPNNKLMSAYTFITGHQLKSNCSECGKRAAMKTIMNYYNKIK